MFRLVFLPFQKPLTPYLSSFHAFLCLTCYLRTLTIVLNVFSGQRQWLIGLSLNYIFLTRAFFYSLLIGLYQSLQVSHELSPHIIQCNVPSYQVNQILILFIELVIFHPSLFRNSPNDVILPFLLSWLVKAFPVSSLTLLVCVVFQFLLVNLLIRQLLLTLLYSRHHIIQISRIGNVWHIHHGLFLLVVKELSQLLFHTHHTMFVVLLIATVRVWGFTLVLVSAMHGTSASLLLWGRAPMMTYFQWVLWRFQQILTFLYELGMVEWARVADYRLILGVNGDNVVVSWSCEVDFCCNDNIHFLIFRLFLMETLLGMYSNYLLLLLLWDYLSFFRRYSWFFIVWRFHDWQHN